MLSRAVALGESARESWRWYRVVVLHSQEDTLLMTHGGCAAPPRLSTP